MESTPFWIVGRLRVYAHGGLTSRAVVEYVSVVEYANRSQIRSEECTTQTRPTLVLPAEATMGIRHHLAENSIDWIPKDHFGLLLLPAIRLRITCSGTRRLRVSYRIAEANNNPPHHAGSGCGVGSMTSGPGSSGWRTGGGPGG